MQRRAAHNLFAEVPHPQHPPRGLAHRRESLYHQVIQGLAFFQAFFEMGSFPFEFCLAQLPVVIFEPVHRICDFHQFLEDLALSHPQKLIQNAHFKPFSAPPGAPAFPSAVFLILGDLGRDS